VTGLASTDLAAFNMGSALGKKHCLIAETLRYYIFTAHNGLRRQSGNFFIEV
jgi:hypothetical protein